MKIQISDEYQKTAAIYDLLFSGALKSIRHNIRTFLQHYQAKTILDLCCGTGEQLRLLEEGEMLLTGVDLSRAMLERARQVSPKSIHYIEADAGSLPFPDSKYDAIIICLALHEKPATQRKAIFREARRLLKPQGHIIIADYSIPPSHFKSTFVGRILIPIIERLAGLNHYTNYKHWIKHGGIQGFLKREHAGKVTLIAPHFKGCINIVAVSNLNS